MVTITNTLFLYDGSEAAETTVRVMSSIASMSKYKTYDDPDIAFSKYHRIVLVVSPKSVSCVMTPGIKEAISTKWLGLVCVDTAEGRLDELKEHAAGHLGKAVDFAAFVDAANAKESAIEAGKALRAAIAPDLPKDDPTVLAAIEAFLQGHNTCVLATGIGTSVRATPIEYGYVNKKIYILSEGGEKFVNLYQNANVSIAVFDPFENLQKLAGLQISGTCRIMEPNEDEYKQIAAAKGITQERIDMMPATLHLLEITPSEATFLWAGFMKEKKAIRQQYIF